MYELVKKTKVLDLNSSYSYLMWGKYFNKTSIIAETDGKLVGFVSGFIQPNSPDVFFVWQVAIDESQRGKGLATRLIQKLLNQPICQNVHYLEATVSPSNLPSKKLFLGIADKLKTDVEVFECFSEDQFPDEDHEAEMTYRIGPFHLSKKKSILEVKHVNDHDKNQTGNGNDCF